MFTIHGRLLAVLGTLSLHASAYSSNMNASGLLGSHFGIPGFNSSYDYVVVGGGTAGLTVARRLAEDSTLSVAVIEAGDFAAFANGNLSQVPAYASYFTGNDPSLKNPYLDWYMYTEPQTQLGGARRLYDSAKIIAGDSGRNFLWQIRGTEGTFQKWTDEVQDQSYTFENLIPFFKRSYSYTPPDNANRPENATAEYADDGWDSNGGPIKVSYAPWVNPVSTWLKLGFEAIGIPSLSSFYGGSLLGWSWLAMTLDPETRVRSSAEAFLQEALMESPNLYIYKSTLARRLLIDGNTTTGVLVDSGGVTYTISATREVILSAGVMRSPQLLMVSGIGNKQTVSEIDVPLVADRPGVGQNMWDNVLVGPTFEVNISTHSSLQQPEYLAQSIQEYNVNRTGMLTNSGGDIAAFEKIPQDMVQESTLKDLNETFPEDWPHLEYLILDAYFGSGNDSSPTTSDSKQYVASSVGLVATFSRGNVTVASSDITVNPVISPNWLLDPRDQEIAIAAFKRGRQLFNTDVMSKIVVEEAYPGAQFTTDEELLNVVRESANSVYNAVGTNKMGAASDAMAVVDSKGRVFGVNNLRVVDASIFPFLPPGQPSATVYALAEKISEDILAALNQVEKRAMCKP